MSHENCNPLKCADCWYAGLGPGRGKPEKPLHDCVRGVLRWSAESWKVELLAARAKKLHERIAELESVAP